MFPIAQIESEPLRPGEAIVAMGFSQAGLRQVTSGTVASIDDSTGRIGLNLAVGPWFSGSPLFNSQGQVIAIVTGRDLNGGLTIAVPVSSAETLLAAARTSHTK
ncbi:hypothetical protein BZM26_09870 [Paraburkholderia strydomiana]|nr:hypothetical protein BZM26_09870 [Paraburkholderia strydomiana]